MIRAGVRRAGALRYLFTDRRGGVSRAPWDSLNLAGHVDDDAGHVAENRTRVARSLGVAEVAVVTAEHGNRVREVQQGGPAGPADGLVTQRRGLALLALAADCMTVVMADPEADVLAVVHCGWRGVVADAVGTTADRMLELGAQPQRVHAAVGPSLCRRCAEVSPQVQGEVTAAAPGAATTTRWGTPGVDLPGAVGGQLAVRGIAVAHTDPRCTRERTDLFSYRRDGLTGRHGLIAVLDESGESDD